MVSTCCLNLRFPRRYGIELVFGAPLYLFSRELSCRVTGSFPDGRASRALGTFGDSPLSDTCFASISPDRWFVVFRFEGWFCWMQSSGFSGVFPVHGLKRSPLAPAPRFRRGGRCDSGLRASVGEDSPISASFKTSSLIFRGLPARRV